MRDKPSAEREKERERGKEHVSVPRCARGDARGKKKSMETSCSIGEVFPLLGHAQVCNLRGFFGKKPHARFGTSPRGDSFAHDVQSVPQRSHCPRNGVEILA